MQLAPDTVNGYMYEDLSVGMAAEFGKTIDQGDIQMFAGVSGDTNPLHIDPVYAATTRFGDCIAHGALTGSLLSAIFGTKLPGPGCIYVSQTYNFKAPVMTGDFVMARAVVRELVERRGRVVFDCSCHVGDVEVLVGDAVLLVPKRADG